MVCIIGIVDARQKGEFGFVEALHAKRQTIDTKGSIGLEIVECDRARIAFHRAFGIRGDREACMDAVENAFHLQRREEGRSAAAEKDARTGRRVVGAYTQLSKQSFHESIDQPCRFDRVEVAIDALLFAERARHWPRRTHKTNRRRAACR